VKTGDVFLLTGPQAAGKTTVARLLAGRFKRAVHLEGDVFRVTERRAPRRAVARR
jgi:ABC-type multidrug transport system ATPase subunit